jgi:hypothetical protein
MFSDNETLVVKACLQFAVPLSAGLAVVSPVPIAGACHRPRFVAVFSQPDSGRVLGTNDGRDCSVVTFIRR